MINKTVLYEVTNSIATITMNRPHVKNAINEQMHEELYIAFQNAKKDEKVKVILLQGIDGSFSSGADLKSIPIYKIEEFDHGDYLANTYNRLLFLMDEIEKPTVAYINGTAVGAGLSLALACDFRIAAKEATFALSFMHIGLIPDAGASYFLPRLVGLGKALEISLGETISADEAVRIGLIHCIDQPMPFLETLKHVPSPAYTHMKKNMKAAFHLPLSAILDLEVSGQRSAGKSTYHRNAVMEFIKGRV